jgi:hypothetical protein
MARRPPLFSHDKMEVTVKTKIVRGLVLFALLSAAAAPGAGADRPGSETPEAFIARMQASLQGGDRTAYLDMHAPGLRAREKDRLDAIYDEFRMDSASLRLAGRQRRESGELRLYVQGFFQNLHAVMMETWVLSLDQGDAGWVVSRKEVSGNAATMFKVRIPSDRFERVRRIEVAHQDIRLSFRDAAVFYDNLPDLETALVVVGRGEVHFAPSDPNEKHQMELLYRKKHLEEKVENLYVRCSPSFFASNVTIDRGDGLPAVTPAEQSRAAAVFSRGYPRSFTIESSIDEAPLSFLPQGKEAVFEFKGRKAGELSYIYHPSSDEEVTLYDRGKQRVVSLYSPAGEGRPAEKRMFVSFGEKFDIRSYELDLSYTPAQSFLSAKARIEVGSRIGRLDVLQLRFNPDLEILKITDGEKRELFYARDRLRRNLYVHFLVPPRQGETARVEIFYRGRIVPPTPSSDVIVQTAISERYRFQPRYETRFFSHAGNWYPGPSEEDYFTARMTILVPPGYDVVANGEMVAAERRNGVGDVVDIEKAGSSVTTFESRRPVKYMSFIIGRFDRRREFPGRVPITMSVSSEVTDARFHFADRAREILDHYERSFGPFPYERLGIVRRLWPASGGHSPASFIVLNEVPWRGETGGPPAVDSPVNLSQWDDYFLAHEIAHQWWGQGVSFATYKDQWLSEGLSQFAAVSFLRKQHGERAFAAILRKFSRWTEKKSFRGPILMGSRLSYFDFSAYQAIVYNKAALALFMLQDMLGEDVFLTGLRSFFEENKYGPARTASFVSAMEAASGKDLKDFFRGWFASHELPDVKVTWTEATVPGGARLTVRVTQVKSRFVFPLWIEWMREGLNEREMVIVENPSQEFVLTLPGRPGKVRINPQKAVPGRFR